MNQLKPRQSPQVEPPIVLPSDLLVLAPEDYLEQFNRAAAYRAQVSEQLIDVKDELGRIEYRKRELKAKVRREANLAGLHLSKQQFEDELMFDKEYGVASVRELTLADTRRRLEAAIEAINLYVQGWSRVVELRRQELVLNAPTITRRDALRKWDP